MSVKNRAYAVVTAMAALVVALVVGLYVYSENGQLLPASMTNNAVKADQRDATVSNDVANHALRK